MTRQLVFYEVIGGLSIFEPDGMVTRRDGVRRITAEAQAT
jgi:hypothetical protein